MPETPRERTARLRREAAAQNKAFREALSSPPVWNYREGSPTRSDLYPTRWVLANPNAEQVAAGISDHINGEDVRMSFTIKAPKSRYLKRYRQGQGDANLPDGVYIFGLRIAKTELLNLFAQHRFNTLVRTVEDIRGEARGVVEAVLEVSMAEAWNG